MKKQPTYMVTQRVPGHAPSVCHPGLSRAAAEERAALLRAASPECVVEIHLEHAIGRKRARRG
jgi:hypothetical protein